MCAERGRWTFATGGAIAGLAGAGLPIIGTPIAEHPHGEGGVA